MGLDQLVGITKKFTNDNSTHILTAVGITGTITTAYLAGRASYFAAYYINREEEELGRTQDPLSLSERTKLVWKLYVPSVVSGAATISAILGANRIGAKKSAAYAAAYSVLDSTFSEYQEKVVEQIGAKANRAIKDDIAQNKVLETPPGSRQIVMSSGTVMCCELYTRRYFMSDMESLRRAQNDLNAKIIHELYTTMSEFYDILGLPHTTNSDNLGWNSDRLMELVFSTVLSEDGVPCIAFEYNYVKPV